MHQPRFQDRSVRREQRGHRPKRSVAGSKPGLDPFSVFDFRLTGQKNAPDRGVQHGRDFQDGQFQPATGFPVVDLSHQGVQTVRTVREVQFEVLFRGSLPDHLSVLVHQPVSDRQFDGLAPVFDRPGKARGVFRQQRFLGFTGPEGNLPLGRVFQLHTQGKTGVYLEVVHNLAGFPRSVHRLERQPVIPSIRQPERDPEGAVFADGNRTFPFLHAVSGNGSFQGNTVHRMAGVAGHFSGNRKKRVRIIGLLLRVESDFIRRKNEIIDPELGMGDIALPVKDIDSVETVPLAHGDGPFPGHGAESVGFQVDVGHHLALGTEDMDPDVLPLAHGVRAFVQVALEQDGFAFQRVTGPVGTPVQEDTSMEISRRNLDILARLINGNGRTPAFSDPRLQIAILLIADHLLEIRRKRRESVQGNLPLDGFLSAPETDGGGRKRLSRHVIGHIDGKFIPLLPDCYRKSMLLVRRPAKKICRLDTVGAVRKHRDGRFHRVHYIEPPVLVPERDSLPMLVRNEFQGPLSEIPAGQDDGIVLEGNPKLGLPEALPDMVHGQVHPLMDALFGLDGLRESLGIVIQGLGIGLRRPIFSPEVVPTILQHLILRQETERIAGILLGKRLHRGKTVLRLLGPQELQIRAGRIPVANLFRQQPGFLGVGEQG